MVFKVVKGALSGRWLDLTKGPLLHRQFVTTQLLASALALAVFPVWILIQGALTFEMGLVFTWLMGPLLATVVLVRTRSLEAAFSLSSISLTGLIGTVCALTGGLQSFALIWLLAVPFEAALSGIRRSIVLALVTAAAGLLLLAYLPALHALQPEFVLTAADPMGLFLGPVMLALYIATLAMKVQAVAQSYQLSSESNAERYRLLAENASDLITQHDVNGSIFFASPATRSLMGVAPDAVEKRGFFNRVHIADRPIYMQLLSEVVSRGLPLVAEFRLKTRSNTIDGLARTDEAGTGTFPESEFSWVEMRARPLWNANQAITGVIATTRDITERREQEEKLRETHLTLKQLSDAKSQFLANMSHELRTPLNAIIGFSDILRQELFGALHNAKQKEYVELIHQSGHHLLQVVTDILDMSKIESGTFDIVPEAFDVNQLVRTCTSMMSQQAETRGIELRTLVPNNLPEAVADPRACRQILINLISNALKFSDSGDKVTVGVRLEGSNLAYFVRDEGIGISKADLARIGQPFFQADSALDRRYEGTGLGVSVVKGLTELHKGHVNFESELGRGTTVTVHIPLNCEADQRTVLNLASVGTEKIRADHEADGTADRDTRKIA